MEVYKIEISSSADNISLYDYLYLEPTNLNILKKIIKHYIIMTIFSFLYNNDIDPPMITITPPSFDTNFYCYLIERHLFRETITENYISTQAAKIVNDFIKHHETPFINHYPDPDDEDDPE